MIDICSIRFSWRHHSYTISRPGSAMKNNIEWLVGFETKFLTTSKVVLSLYIGTIKKVL